MVLDSLVKGESSTWWGGGSCVFMVVVIIGITGGGSWHMDGGFSCQAKSVCIIDVWGTFLSSLMGFLCLPCLC